MKWKRIMSREYGVGYTEVSLRSLSEEVKDLIPVTFTDQIYVPEENNEVCYIDEEKWNLFIAKLKEKWNVSNIEEYEKQFLENGNAYLDFAKRLVNEDLTQKSNKALVALYKEYQKLGVRYASFVWTAFILNVQFSEETRAIIHKHVKENPEAYYDEAFRPEKLSSVLELAAIIDEKGVKEAIEVYENFKWISCLDIHNEPWTCEEFLNHIKNIPKKKKVGVEEKEKYTSLMSGVPEKERAVLQTAKRFAYFKDLRDDFRRKTVFYIRGSLFKEIARRMRVTLKEVAYLLEDEIIGFLETGIVPSMKLVEERKKGFVIYYGTDGGIVCDSGEDILPAIEKLGVGIAQGEMSKEIKGMSASKGTATGKVAIVKGVKDLSKVQEGDILVAVTTHPDFVPAMQKAAAIVTDEGGMTSHAAIVSRELEIPCIVGTKVATRVLKDGDNVFVDADNGNVVVQ